MMSRKERAHRVRLAVALCVAGVSTLEFMAPAARAGTRQFLVILANSPKQYPNPDRVPQGQPEDGLPNPQLIFNQYFDTTSPDIGSFAEYWEEISYGDVTIAGETTDWISLPWAILPPLIDPTRDRIGDPPLADNLNDPNLRNSPSNFYDLDDQD